MTDSSSNAATAAAGDVRPAAESRPRPQHGFRRRQTANPLSGPERARQGQVVRAAQAAFGDHRRVIAFLNNPHARLDRRPLDLAIESDAGLAAVEAAIGAERPLPF